MTPKNRLFAIILVVAHCASVPQVLSDVPSESLAGIWRVADHDGEQQRVIKLGDTPQVPPSVQTDLDAFNASLAQVPSELRYIAVSLNGRAFGIGHMPTSEEPTGVWIWPSWRDPSFIHFGDFNYFEFLSNAHVYLQRREPGKWSVNRVAAINDPETLYSLPGIDWRNLRVHEDGRWMSTSKQTEQLVVGEFDPENPEAGADEATVVPLEFEGAIDNLAWVRDGDFIVVEILDYEDNRTLKVLAADSFDVTATVIGSMFSNRGRLVGQEHFYGIHGDSDVVFRVLPDGTIEWLDRTFATNEDPADWSPSGWFTLTYQREHVGVFETKVRRTVLAPTDAPLPSWPVREVDGNEINAGRYFWLSWE